MSTPHCPLVPSASEGKTLVICEKPSVARDLAKVLGGSSSPAEGYIPFPLGYISWARGHMLELSEPSDYRGDWKNWAWAVLPMVPDGLKFTRTAKSDCRGQLSILKKLYGQSDVIVNACDAGREGELIWWEILRHCGWGAGLEVPKLGPKPALRFWAQSNTAGGLADAWEAMKPVEERAGLAQGAYARSEADWLLGMNLTRAATLGFQVPIDPKSGKRGFWSVGRVQTPVLALIAARDTEISNFKSKPFYQVKATFQGDSPFEALVLVPEGVKAFVSDADGPEASEGKDHKNFLTQEDAKTVLDRLLSGRPSPWDVSETTKKSQESAPGLFSLTSLQKWCNQSWSWEAKRTLDAAQAAYESDKTLTYPRTDASFLPVDSKSKMDQVYQSIRSGFLDPEGMALPPWVCMPSTSPRASYLFDDSKLTDHYAIVPTGVIPSNLESDSGKVWLAVVRRFLVAFGPAAQVSTLARRLVFEETSDVAVVSGKTYDSLGWIELDNVLCTLTGHTPKSPAGLLPKCPSSTPMLEGRLHQGQTTPPKAFTEATLLALMENIHTKLEESEEELRDILAAKGIGTPATRAAIIELLIARKYIKREKKGSTTYVRATETGQQLIANLRGAGLDFLTQPQLTAEWEDKLGQMERGTGLGRNPFLMQLVSEVEDAVEKLKASAPAASFQSAASPEETSALCPKSGEPVMDCGNYWVFPGYPDAKFYKSVAQRPIKLEELMTILRDGKGPVMEGFVSKKGAKFSACLAFAEGKLTFVFEEGTGRTAEETKNTCPKSGQPIMDSGSFWVFPGVPGVKFWKLVAKRKMRLSDYEALVRDGKTKSLDGFKSKAGNDFSAMLILKSDGVGFEFPPRGQGSPTTVGMKGPGAKGKSSSSGHGQDGKKKKKTW
jgi:DNA topoisomerase III